MNLGDHVEVTRGRHSGLLAEIEEMYEPDDMYWLKCLNCERGGYIYGPFTKQDFKRITSD